jgi:hypothetical protein
MHAGEPPSLRVQNFWQTVSRSEQVFASAGATIRSVTTPVAIAAKLKRNNLRTRAPKVLQRIQWLARLGGGPPVGKRAVRSRL